MNNLNSARLGRGTLLVVDKDPTEQAVFGQKLKLAGYQVVPVLTAGSVLPIVSTARPDLIILDLAFPDFSGHALLKALTLLGCPCPVVILRSVHDGNVAPPMFRTNGLRIVPEPRDSAALVQTVISTLAERFEAEPTPTHTDIAHRWAQLVIRGCTVDSDIKTVPCWASRVGVSAGSLREMCEPSRVCRRAVGVSLT